MRGRRLDHGVSEAVQRKARHATEGMIFPREIQNDSACDCVSMCVYVPHRCLMCVAFVSIRNSVDVPILERVGFRRR